MLLFCAPNYSTLTGGFWPLVGVILLLLSPPCMAAGTHQQAVEATDDVRVLIDISGSMKENDPKNLRIPALRLFVSLLPNGAKAGVWTFGQWVNMLVKHGVVDEHWKKIARSASDQISSHGLFTNMEDALLRSTWDWNRPDPAHTRSLILLTDGFVDVSKDPAVNRASRQKVLKEILPRLQSAGVKIHTIALSEAADSPLLQQLAAATGGWFETVKNSEGLERLFLKLFEKTTTADTLPITNNHVTVDKSVREATFLIFNKDKSKKTSLTSPDAKTFTRSQHPSEMHWHQETSYDLITIKNPVAGEWTINTDMDPDNRVLVVTDLKLKTTTLPNILAAGKSIPFFAHLEQQGEVIRRKDFLQFVKVTLRQTSTDGQEWKHVLKDDGNKPDTTANDGIFSGLLNKSLTEGEHAIEVAVDGTTFKRDSRQIVKVLSQPVDAHISTIDPNHVKVTVIPYQTLINSASMRISASHTLPSGKTEELTIPRSSPSEWRLTLSNTESDGRHSVTVHITGSRPDGSVVDANIGPMFFQLGTNNAAKEQAESPPQTPSVNENDDSDKSTDDHINWLMVGLRILVLNIFITIFAVAGYMLWPRIKARLIPLPSKIISQ
jgi:uncharacterized protein (TIGR03503 family)